VQKQGWADQSIVSLLKKAFNTEKVTIQTDVNSSAYGEFYARQGTLKSSLAYITVGTGIGVGLVINGKPVTGLMHPEGGHLPLVKTVKENEQDLNSCNFHESCVEGYSTNVFASRVIGADLHDLKDHQDHEIFKDIGMNIGQLCASVCLMTSVEKIIIGGGLSRSKNFLENVRGAFGYHIKGYIKKGIIPDDYIELCEDYDSVGMRGAAYLSM
jgi:fructokinase